MKATRAKPASRPLSRWALLGAPPGTRSDLPVIGEKMPLTSGICNVHSTTLSCHKLCGDPFWVFFLSFFLILCS